MMPNMANGLLNWGSSVQLLIVNTTLVDYEAAQEILQAPTITMMITAMSPRRVQYKEEGERRWKWLEGRSTTKVEADTQLQDPDGVQYRIRAVTDWGQAGFYVYEMTEMPAVIP